MQEDFLHYIWKHKKFDTLNLKTTQGEQITLIFVGEHNHNSGPDFFNSQLKIAEQIWAGNVEIHIKSSDWFLHNHETDKAYDNVILHVVWEYDTEIFRKNNSEIPTLVLKEFVNDEVLQSYQKLFSKQSKWINCENDFATVDDFVLNNWLERLYFERLERKSEDINQLLKTSKNNWEAVLFKMLAKNFGLKVNGESFFSLANSIDFSILRKLQTKQQILEALFFGQSGLLDNDFEDVYFKLLQKEYQFIKQKFQLDAKGVLPLQFFRLRPPNFPTIRLSQLASLYSKEQNLFSKVIQAKTKDDIYTLFQVHVSEFWKTHYTFNKVSKQSAKKITESFIDLLIINTIIPIQFSYAKQKGESIDQSIVELIQQIASEKNSIIKKFNDLKTISKSALQSQAIIQLKTEYCNKNKCLQCSVGNFLLDRNTK